MISATDSARPRPDRRPLAALALALLIAEPGCARLRSFRRETPPAFGTDTAWSEKRLPGQAARGDLYADLAGKGAREPATADDATTPAAKDAAPVVALQAPVSPATHGATAPADGAEPARSEATKPEGTTLPTILTSCRAALDAMSTYRVKMAHQERVGGTLKPAEDVVLNVRRAPKAVRLEWPDGQNKGREVIYAADANGGLMHVRMGESLIPLPRVSMAPDSPLATRNSRHPITEAGFDTIVSQMEETHRRGQAGDPSLGRISYEGVETPEGLTTPCLKVVRVTPEQETWSVYIDQQTHLPAFVQCVAANGDLLERYTFRDPVPNVPELAAADAFNPDARWGPAKGLFQRMARTGSEPEAETRSR